MVQPLWRTAWRFLKKLKIELPWDPAVPLLDMYLGKTITGKDASTLMFFAALFAIAGIGEQSKYPSKEEWIKIMYIYVMEYYSDNKRYNIVPFVEIWMNLETVIQCEVS